MWQSVKLPPGKVLIPGVISHATNIVEHPELVAQRLVRLAKIVGRENVIGGTDCGFAQSPFAQRVHPTIMWAKLQIAGRRREDRDAGTVGPARRGMSVVHHQTYGQNVSSPSTAAPPEQIRTAPAAMSFAFSTET